MPDNATIDESATVVEAHEPTLIPTEKEPVGPETCTLLDSCFTFHLDSLNPTGERPGRLDRLKLVTML